ncbi:MAG: ATP-binding protein, partial [Dehalococcoidia bacterium]
MNLLQARTPLVGRQRELAALQTRLDAICAGAGGAVLLAGEAGIGKSRVVAEVKMLAARQGFLILQGACFEADRSFPYAPLLDLLRTQLIGCSPEQVAGMLGPAAPELVKLLPELIISLPGVMPAAVLEPEGERRRLFHTLTELFTRLAAGQPALIIVEDLHWSDDTSLELLLYLARRITAQRVLLLLTYRGDEVQPSLAHALAELERERLATEVVLPRLLRVEVDALIRAFFGQERPVHPDFLDTIHGMTEGNPFFIEEVLKSLVTSGDIFLADGRWDRRPMRELRVPRTVQDAVQRRVVQLSGDARDVLLLAAVAGQRFDFALLQTLTERDDAGLLPLIKELIDAQLVVEDSAEQFAFRHALTRHAVYSGLLERERRILHQRIAEAVEQCFPAALDMHVEDLAYHFHAAGAWEEALVYARRAGERAQLLYAPRASIDHFTRALEAAHRLGLSPPSDLHRGRGLAYETLGDFEAARIDLDAALDLVRTTGDRLSEWQTLLDLGQLWASRDYERTGGYYWQALDLARTTDDAATRAHSLNRLGNWHLNVEQPVEGQRYHEDALAIFQDLNDRRGIAETLDLLGLMNTMCGDLRKSEAYYQEANALFRGLDDRQGMASSLSVLACRGMDYVLDAAVSVPTTLTAPLREAELAVTLAREIGWRSAEAYALLVLGGCLATQGDFERALRCELEGLAIAEEIEHREWIVGALCTLGALYRELLALPAARAYLDQALLRAREIGSPHWVRIAAGLLASVCVSEADLARGAATLDATLSPDTQSPMTGQRSCW